MPSIWIKYIEGCACDLFIFILTKFIHGTCGFYSLQKQYKSAQANLHEQTYGTQKINRIITCMLAFSFSLSISPKCFFYIHKITMNEKHRGSKMVSSEAKHTCLNIFRVLYWWEGVKIYLSWMIFMPPFLSQLSYPPPQSHQHAHAYLAVLPAFIFLILTF